MTGLTGGFRLGCKRSGSPLLAMALQPMAQRGGPTAETSASWSLEMTSIRDGSKMIPSCRFYIGRVLSNRHRQQDSRVFGADGGTETGVAFD
jgi:hypothetical protein